MPGYAGQGLAVGLYTGSIALFLAEPLTPNVPSMGVELRRVKGTSVPFGFSIQAAFSGDPGAYQLNVEGSDSDTPSTYVPIGQLSPGVSPLSPTFTSRIAFNDQSMTRFVRVTPVLNPNSVTGTVTVTK